MSGQRGAQHSAISALGTTDPLNAVRPDQVPLRPQGRIPVLARLTWPTGAQWVPARAIRWTPTAVMVIIATIDEDYPEATLWLPARDVRRSLPAE